MLAKELPPFLASKKCIKKSPSLLKIKNIKNKIYVKQNSVAIQTPKPLTGKLFKNAIEAKDQLLTTVWLYGGFRLYLKIVL